ncbi:MAG: hypothetical protein Ct9H90mP16_04170 [Candidatus Poseidoniales archaeon]|nr:MAG: hypothetical protein Ct9H90mP16_04170 [Candidatus Poseidoniales archaeon]
MKKPERVQSPLEGKGTVVGSEALGSTKCSLTCPRLFAQAERNPRQRTDRTSVDLGSKPMRLEFTSEGKIARWAENDDHSGAFCLHCPPESVGTGIVPEILAEAASKVDTLVFLPESTVASQGLAGPNVVPMIAPSKIGNIESHGNGTRMVEMTSWNPEAWSQVKDHPLLVSVRLPFAGDWKSTLMEMVENGVSIIHLESDYHGEADDGRFVMDLYQEAHFALVEKGCRDEVTLLGTGGLQVQIICQRRSSLAWMQSVSIYHC